MPFCAAFSQRRRLHWVLRSFLLALGRLLIGVSGSRLFAVGSPLRLILGLRWLLPARGSTTGRLHHRIWLLVGTFQGWPMGGLFLLYLALTSGLNARRASLPRRQRLGVRGGFVQGLLARALSHDLPMSGLRDLWIENADVTVLLSSQAKARALI